MSASAMRWWGWGVDGHDGPLPPRGAALLHAELSPGRPAAPRRPPVTLEQVILPEPALSAPARAALVAAVGAEHVLDDHATRVLHAAGRSYPDLVRLRTGALECAPDAVVAPAGRGEVAVVLEACAEHDVAVVPFGGGTSVVGGVDAVRGGHHAAIALDLRRLDHVEIDARSLLATFGAGTLGPAAERALAARGLTLGHHPQSFEFSTVGGWVATRSAGQASTGYGRIDALVRGVRLTAPAGEVVAQPFPATAAGPDLRALVVGSEGTLGVITEATLRVRAAPSARRHEAWALPGFAAGSEAMRALAQAGAAPAVTRLSDEEETRFNLAMAGRAGQALAGYARARGQRRPCLLICGHEGTEDGVREGRRAAGRILRGHGAVSLGPAPGRAWAQGRFHGPYLRDELMAQGLLVDTLETAATWSGLLEAYRGAGSALRRTLAARGTPALVGCHISHLYPTGASLYFTYLARAEPGAELEQWQAAKAAASDALVAAGATITHHHAVGRDHAPWLGAEVGELGLELLRAARARLDPDGIMNPGKLVTPPVTVA
jgi:alkyldihydroxyacetonephosphate synthase